MAFCKWLTEQERTAEHLPTGCVARLPTEAEWEYACRAGTQTIFWWGDTKEGADGRLNWGGKDDGFEFVSPVDYYGAQGRNRFGLADMLGNMAEWCLDGFDPMQAHGECYTAVETNRVARGGALDDPPGIVRCAFRHGRPPDYRSFGTGFRICYGRDVGGASKK